LARIIWPSANNVFDAKAQEELQAQWGNLGGMGKDDEMKWEGWTMVSL